MNSTHPPASGALSSKPSAQLPAPAPASAPAPALNARNIASALGFVLIAFIFFKARLFSDMRLRATGQLRSGVVRAKMETNEPIGVTTHSERLIKIDLQGPKRAVYVFASPEAWARVLPGETVDVLAAPDSARALLANSSLGERLDIICFGGLLVGFALAFGYALADARAAKKSQSSPETR